MPTGCYIRSMALRQRISNKLKGQRISDETKQKMSKRMIGNTFWKLRKSRKHSKETIEKIRQNAIGRKHTEKTKKKLSELQKGKKLSEQVIENIRKRMIGNKHAFGKKLSITTRLKMSNSKKGKNAPFWKGGITSTNKLIREGLTYNIWRENILKRDKFTCQKCSKIGGKLNIHHIKSFSKFPELRFEISNGITLCKECHTKFHNIYGKFNHTEEQFYIFYGDQND